ncbi:MAG TPA: recombinase family protein, partial [Candidatus Pelethocola excrementipullorum]|nr:recombinase family protein [Candidatus Pelethocola excrementipullorum]
VKEKEVLQTDMLLKEDSLTLEDLIETRDKFISILGSGSLQEKRACLTTLIDRITVDDDNVNIILKKF